MTNARTPPPVRRLRRELRALRGDRSALSVATDLGWSETKLTRLETTSIAPRRTTITELLAYYRVEDPKHAEILALVTAANQPGPWDDAQALLPPGATTYLALEAACATLRICAPNELPGLLQTDDYAAAIAARRVDLSPGEAKTCAELHRRRLKVLDDPDASHLWALIDEAALLRTIGDTDVMRNQVAHLVALAARPTINIQILRLADGVQPGWTPFTILDFADTDPEIVCVETGIGPAFIEDGRVIDYRRAFERHLANAQPVKASTDILEKTLTAWPRG